MEKKKKNTLIINLRTDNQPNDIPNELRYNWKFQNNTELTNIPPKKHHFSFKPSKLLHNKSSSSHKQKLAPLDSCIDFTKFKSSIITIKPTDNDDCNNIHNHTYPNINNNNDKETIKTLLDTDYKRYTSTIKKIYPTFKFNHYSKYADSKGVVDVFKWNRSCLQVDEYYLNTPHNVFVVKTSLLEQNEEQLHKTNKLLMNSVGEIEMEVDRVLNSSSIIESYYYDNIQLKDTIDVFIKRIGNKKEMKEMFKNKMLYNSSKIILLQYKKQQMKNIVNVLQHIQMIHHNISGLLSNEYNNSDRMINLNKENQILTQIKKDINTLKRKYKQINILTYIERTLNSINYKSEEKYLKAFISAFFDLITLGCNYTITTTINDNNVNTISTKYDLSLTPQQESPQCIDECNSVLLSLLTNTPTINKQLTNLLDIFAIIITESFDINTILYSIKEPYKHTIHSLYVNNNNNNNHNLQQLSNSYYCLLQNHFYLIHLLQTNFGSSPKMFTEITRFIINEIKTKITLSINPIIKASINTPLSSVMSMLSQQDKLIPLIKLQYIKKELSSKIELLFKLINLNTVDFFFQYENDFLFSYFETYSDMIQIELENEDWSEIKYFDEKFQKMLDVISTDIHNQNDSQIENVIDITSVITSTSSSTPKQNESTSETEEEETPDESIITSNSNSQHGINVLTIKGAGFKQIKTSLTLIDFIYNTYRIIYYIKSNEHIQTIILQLCKIINIFSSESSRQIINGELNSKTITEKEIILVNSTLCLLGKVLFLISLYLKSQNDEVINNSLSKTINKLNEFQSTCHDTVIKLIREVTESVLSDFEEIDFNKYPVLKAKEYNSYIKRFCKVKRIYDGMVNAFEDNDIMQIFTVVLGGFFDKFMQIVNKKGRIEKEEMLKQFRGEMVYLKRLIKMFEFVDVNGLVDKIDAISKNANPDKVVKRRKDRSKNRERPKGNNEDE